MNDFSREKTEEYNMIDLNRMIRLLGEAVRITVTVGKYLLELSTIINDKSVCEEFN